MLLTSDAILCVYFTVLACDEVARRDFRELEAMNPTERAMQMRSGKGVEPQSKGQYWLLHLTLLRDARDQGIPTAFRFFEESENRFLASQQWNLNMAATKQALTDLFNAVIAHRTWEATRTVLLHNSDVLLNGLAEFLIENDDDNMREGAVPSRNLAFSLAQNRAYRDLLRDSRQSGIAYAWPRFQLRVQEITAQFPQI
jgi:hypothetical protein